MDSKRSERQPMPLFTRKNVATEEVRALNTVATVYEGRARNAPRSREVTAATTFVVRSRNTSRYKAHIFPRRPFHEIKNKIIACAEGHLQVRTFLFVPFQTNPVIQSDKNIPRGFHSHAAIQRAYHLSPTEHRSPEPLLLPPVKSVRACVRACA